MKQVLVNIGLLLLIIPTMFIFKGNMYALIITMALPCIHYGWILNKAVNDTITEAST